MFKVVVCKVLVREKKLQPLNNCIRKIYPMSSFFTYRITYNNCKSYSCNSYFSYSVITLQSRFFFCFHTEYFFLFPYFKLMKMSLKQHEKNIKGQVPKEVKMKLKNCCQKINWFKYIYFCFSSYTIILYIDGNLHFLNNQL